MALQKTPLQINFAKGLAGGQDPNQVPAGNFLRLENTMFDVGGRLTKRPGFPALTNLPDANSTTLTTLNGNLLATGTQLRAYSSETNSWLNQGKLQPVDFRTSALVRTSNSQTTPDSAVTEAAAQYYQISDTNTGQIIVAKTALPATAVCARVFLLGRFFVITFLATVTATPHLRFIAIPTANPSSPGTATDISTTVSSLAAGYDGIVANNALYVAYDASDIGGAIRVNKISSTLGVSSPLVIPTYTASLITVTADTSGNSPIIWIAGYETGGPSAFCTAISASLVSILAPTAIIGAVTVNELTSAAINGVFTLFYQVTNTVSALGSVRSDYVNARTCTQTGTLGTAYTVARSVGLATKAYFGTATDIYLGLAYGQALQPTYFISDVTGNIVAKFAYQNGAGYATTQVLPSVSSYGNVHSFAYLLKDLLVSVNKTQGAATSSGVYTQTGVNLAQVGINTNLQSNSEIGGSLQLTGGFVWQYDGVKPVELGFHVYPEGLAASTTTTTGSMIPQQYYYSFCYEWTDAAGQLHRSAPSVPVGQLVPAGTNTNKNTINVPTLRLTYKTGNNVVRLVGYRWSTAQQSYYQFTSISSPSLNDTTVDYVAVVDTLADASILGNTLLYTTGGVLENTGAPASTTTTLFKNRMWVIDAENRNLLWYTKQVLSNTPVEFTDLQTLYVAPTAGAQGATGDCTALAALDDKLIIFKQSGIYYLTGSGPDITGANNDFSDATFITAAVGCENPSSITLTPQGLMFESQKGIWLLTRGMATQYIGADVQAQTGVASVVSAITPPGYNEARFSMDDGSVLVYDYYYGQWSSYRGVSNISSTLYNTRHTVLKSSGRVLQQQPDTYIDDTAPVLLSFTTSWLTIVGLMGLQRAYYFTLLSNYKTPHRLAIGVAYNFNPSLQQQLTLTPSNVNISYGSDTLYGGSSPYGGVSDVEQFRVFLTQQKCQSLSVTVSELYDSSQGVAAGAGLTISGLNFAMGAKKAFPTLNPNQSGS